MGESSYVFKANRPRLRSLQIRRPLDVLWQVDLRRYEVGAGAVADKHLIRVPPGHGSRSYRLFVADATRTSCSSEPLWQQVGPVRPHVPVHSDALDTITYVVGSATERH